jgi:alanyl-tRNA synthetase
MKASDVRQKFLDFFEQKGHKIVQSAPIVVKNDPTLMFTNAGMNQFKDFFLGNKVPKERRVADTQKCLRVSGKHNDLEEVGVDTYHHTMFEMLGNWSFGDYFKKEAIAWAWELLTEVYKLPKDRLYVTVFEGDKSDDLSADNEAAAFWKEHVDEERILFCDKKDNFWEMGETGPCGPCSEIHMDLRPEGERAKADGKELVNKDHDQVIELWNLVFIQYNRKADGSLENLPEKHVDTGMGLERVTRAIHLKSSNYDTDLFMDTIRKLEEISGKQYGKNEQLDIAFRVIADHIRAVSFTIADGQLPSNEKAGYVVRRILRRAIRYGYSFLDLEQPFIYRLVKVLLHSFGSVFSELQEQKDFVAKVIEQEEKSFLNTLNKGLKLFDKYSKAGKEDVSGIHAFELYDTYGFPIDLTELLAREKGIGVDLDGFQVELQKQKERSRADAQKSSGDWNVLQEDEKEEFIGYDQLEANVKITRYREVEAKGKKYFHLVFNYTPFYAESGGQVGDKGVLLGTENEEKISVVDTQKENDLIIQITEKLPENSTQVFVAKVNYEKRKLTTYNHSATHLLHAALKEVLGEHVNQKGSLVNDKYLRFDFSHFQKVSEEELQRIEQMVNDKIWQAITLDEKRDVPFQQAIDYGATALFGEKYGDVVRVITFDPNYSIELCGGTHVKNTAHIGLFKITSESAVAAGVRRIEAITHTAARKQLKEQTALLEEVRAMLGNPQQVTKGIESLKKENEKLKEQVQAYEAAQLEGVKNNLTSSVALVGGINTLVAGIEVANAGLVKDLAFQLNNEIDNLFAVLVANAGGKPNITIIMADVLVKERGLNAGQLVRDWAKAIRGGGGGQPFFAQAGGSDLSGLEQALDLARNFVATTF